MKRVTSARRVLVAGAAVSGAALVLLLTTAALAVHDVGVFELDGNAITDHVGSALPDDWDRVYSSTGNYVGKVFVPDPTSQTFDDILTGGSTKDDLPLSGWRWTIGSVPDKDNITDAYAAGYTYTGEQDCPADSPPSGLHDPKCTNPGDTLLYFGADRFAQNGDSQIGFWFFKNAVAKVGTPTGSFSGDHAIGDILILSDFTKGGTLATMKIYKWVGSGGSSGTLDLVATEVSCLNTTGADTGCAQENSSAQLAPWPYTPKSGPAGTFPTGGFWEGGVNLTALGLDLGCGSTFLAETRSSQEVNAVLKDFALGAFNLCDAKISISPDGTNKVGASHTFTVTVMKKTPASPSFVPAVGVHPAVTLTNTLGASGAITTNNCTLSGTNESGQCTVIISSAATGVTKAHAAVDVTIGSTTLHRQTDGVAPNSGDATKTWVDARITIGNSATNKVDTDHTFTVTVQKDLGDGNGWVGASGLTVTPSLLAGSVGSITGGTCTGSGTTNASGQCTIVVHSDVVGTTTVNAGTTVVIGTVNIPVSTTGYGAYSISNVKTWVDARITIGTSGTNFIYSPHTFTVTVQKDLGDGSGWVAASGVTVTPSETGVGSITGGTCQADGSTKTNASGQCTIIVNSTATGQSTVNASATVGVGGVNIGVSTTGYGAHDISNVKTWVAAQVTLNKTFEDGVFTHPGQACFTLSRVPVPPPPVSSDNAQQCGTGTSLSFTWHDLIAGDYTITETTTPAGYDTMTPITFTVDAEHLSFSFNREDPLKHGGLNVAKLLGPAGTPWTGPDVTFYVCGPSSSSTPGTCNASSVDLIATILIPSQGNPAAVTDLEEGYYTVCEDVPAGYEVTPAGCQVAQVLAGVTGTSAATVTFTNTPPCEGCTPGFWQGGLGVTLWDETSDPGWTAHGGAGANPFVTTTLFNTYFAPASSLNGLTMLDLVGSGGGSDWVHKAARDVVAAYLNSAFGMNYPYTTAQVSAMWADAVAAGTDNAFESLHNLLAPANQLGCPIK